MTEAVAWDLAERVAVRVAGREPFSESYHYDSLQPDFEELTAEAVGLISIQRFGQVGDLSGVKKAAPATKRPVNPEATYLGKIVQALLDLKHARPSSLEPSRNLVELVLRRLHRLSDQESADVTAASIASILHQLEGLDERFLEETRRRVEMFQVGG